MFCPIPLQPQLAAVRSDPAAWTAAELGRLCHKGCWLGSALACPALLCRHSLLQLSFSLWCSAPVPEPANVSSSDDAGCWAEACPPDLQLRALLQRAGVLGRLSAASAAKAASLLLNVAPGELGAAPCASALLLLLLLLLLATLLLAVLLSLVASLLPLLVGPAAVPLVMLPLLLLPQLLGLLQPAVRLRARAPETAAAARGPLASSSCSIAAQIFDERRCRLERESGRWLDPPDEKHCCPLVRL
jgi:hypothetical protein